MIDQESRLKENGKDFASKLPREVERALRRRNTIFNIISSENNHNSYFLREFGKYLESSIRRQSRTKRSLHLLINVKEKNTLEDPHYEEANYNVLLKSLLKDYSSLFHQWNRLQKKKKISFFFLGSGIALTPVIFFYGFYTGGESTPIFRDYVTFILGLVALGGSFTYFQNRLKKQIAKRKKSDRGFLFEKELITKKINSRGFRRKPAVILIDNAELLDDEPFQFLLNLMKTDQTDGRSGSLWVFLFTAKSDNRDKLIVESREKKYVNHFLELKPYSEEQINLILQSNSNLKRKGNYLISIENEKHFNHLQRSWVDLSGKNDNKSIFTEYDILKIITFSGNRHHIESWNPSTLADLFSNAPEAFIQALITHLGYIGTTETDYFELAQKLSNIEEFFQSKRFAMGKYVIPFRLRIVLESDLDDETLLLIQLFWIRKYLANHETGLEDLLAKRILYRINAVKRLYSENQAHEGLILEVRSTIIRTLDGLFEHLSFRTFLQLFKALLDLNSLLLNRDFSLVEKEKLAPYSAYLFELSGDSHFKLNELFHPGKEVLVGKIFSIYKRFLSKESPVLLLTELESIQNLENIQEKPWLSNLYHLLLLFLRVREADGVVFKLRKDLSIIKDSCLPVESEFPVFEIRFRFLLLDIYMIQGNSKLFLSTYESLVSRINNIVDNELALSALVIYWRALAVHYLLWNEKVNPGDHKIQSSVVDSLFSDDREVEKSHAWVKDQYVDAEFLFEHLGLRLPLIDLFYSQARLIQQFTEPKEDNISEWYASWFNKFKASVAIQQELGLSLNVPEIHIRIFLGKQSILGLKKCAPEIKNLIEILRNHNFNDRILLRWKYHEAGVYVNYLPAKAIEVFNEILESKDRKGYLAYAFEPEHSFVSDRIVELHIKVFILSEYLTLGETEIAKERLFSLENEFYPVLYAKEGKEKKAQIDLECMILAHRLEVSPELATQTFFEIEGRDDLLGSFRFPYLLYSLLKLIPNEELDFDLLTSYFQTINSNISKHLRTHNFSEYLLIIEVFKKSSYATYPLKLKHNIRKMVEIVVSTEGLIKQTSFDKLEKQFGNLLACDSSEPLYIEQWDKWSMLTWRNFSTEKLCSIYDEKSSYEVFQIYLDFFSRYENDLPFQKDYLKEAIEEQNQIFEQFALDNNLKHFSQACLLQLKKNKAPLISSGRIHRIFWLYVSFSGRLLHHLEQPDQSEAKKILEDLFNPSIITDYLRVVQNIRSIPAPMKKTIEELLIKHQKNEFRLKK